MATTALLATLIGIVTAVVTMFGGALVGLAPPHSEIDKTAPSVALASAFSIALFLLVYAAVHKWEIAKPTYIVLGIASLAVSVYLAMLYRTEFRNLTIEYPEDAPEIRFIKGSEYTEEVKKYKAERDANASDHDLLRKFPSPTLVWTPLSIDANAAILERMYFSFLAAFVVAVLCASGPFLSTGQKATE